jgi:hypothetical protein
MRVVDKSVHSIAAPCVFGRGSLWWLKCFIVLSGSHLAAHAIVHMPMLQIVGRREAERR